jgi:hypothetical protein
VLHCLYVVEVGRSGGVRPTARKCCYNEGSQPASPVRPDRVTVRGGYMQKTPAILFTVHDDVSARAHSSHSPYPTNLDRLCMHPTNSQHCNLILSLPPATGPPHPLKIRCVWRFPTVGSILPPRIPIARMCHSPALHRCSKQQMSLPRDGCILEWRLACTALRMRSMATRNSI